VICAVVAVVVAMVAVAGTITEMVVGMGPIETRVVARVHDLTETTNVITMIVFCETISIPVPMDLYSYKRIR